jgi:hypothetical protein
VEFIGHLRRQIIGLAEGLLDMRQFARFLEKLEEPKDVDGNSVLSNSMIIYDSGNSDGNFHTHSNLPVALPTYQRHAQNVISSPVDPPCYCPCRDVLGRL